jgi:hypothetical protein
MGLRKQIRKAIIDVSPSLEGTKLLDEIVKSIANSLERNIEKEKEEAYESGIYRGRNPIEYSEHR